MLKSDERNSQVSNLVDKCNEEALINSLSNSSTLFSDSTFKFLVAAASTNIIAKLKDKNIK